MTKKQIQAGLNENLQKKFKHFHESEMALRYLASEGEINVLPTTYESDQFKDRIFIQLSCP